MNRTARHLAVIILLAARLLHADNLAISYIKHRFNAESVQLREIDTLRSHITDGKLHLRLHDFIELMLKNSADLQLTKLDVYTSANQIISAKSPFDPSLIASFTAQRAVTPLSFGGGFFSGTTGLGGTNGTDTSNTGTNGTGVTSALLPQTIRSLNQSTSLLFSQLLPTGQTISTSFTGQRSSGDEYTFPAVFGQLNFQLVQPLLQNRTNLQARAPLINARTQLLVTSEQSEATIGNSVALAARQYWSAVQARDSIKVQEQTFALAQKSYDRDKLALDLGALASLDIFQSQTQLAERKRDLLASQYQYRTELDGLRHFIGADLTPKLRSTEIVLDDDPSQAPPRSGILPFEDALTKALASRPDFKASNQRLSIDALNARAARDSLLPQLNLTVNGGSSGPSFGQVTTAPYPGYSETLRQIAGFDFPAYGVGVQLNFPFRNSTAKAQLSDALVNRVRDQYQKRSVQELITQDVRQAIDNIELADVSISAAVVARDLARKNVDAEQQKYQLGTITAFELLDSQTRLASSESAVLNAQVTYQQALVNYQFATWALLESFGVIVDTPTVR